MKTDKRYLVTMEYYVYAENERLAVEYTNDIAREIDLKYDCKPNIMSIKEAKFGKPTEEPQYLGFSSEFIDAWTDWVEHKKSVKNSYKSIKTQSIAIANLCRQCDGVEKRMIESIYHSIGNNYKGIYEQRNNQKQGAGSLTEQFIQTLKGSDF
jgi:hypothetical protein